jgi:hypothetical protein
MRCILPHAHLVAESVGTVALYAFLHPYVRVLRFLGDRGFREKRDRDNEGTDDEWNELHTASLKAIHLLSRGQGFLHLTLSFYDYNVRLGCKSVKSHKDIRVGEFFVENGIITREQLDEALELQRFNRDRILGEILVTQGVLTKEEIIMAMEMYMMLTGLDTEHADEWLDQEEIDLLLEKCKNNPKEC